jgi:hypothetical protein
MASSSSSSSSQNDLLCRLKKSLDTIFDDKHLSEKIGEIVKLWDMDTPLPPGSCGGGIKPLVDIYLYDTSVDYYENVISEVRKGKKRTDKFMTSVFPIYKANSFNEIYTNKDHTEVGKAYLGSWGIVGSEENPRSAWTAGSTLLLKKDLIGLERGMIGLDNDVITGSFDGANYFDNNTKEFTTILFDTIKQGSDGHFYRLKKLARDKRNPDINSYRMRVYLTQNDAGRARIVDEEATREGEEKK